MSDFLSTLPVRPSPSPLSSVTSAVSSSGSLNVALLAKEVKSGLRKGSVWKDRHVEVGGRRRFQRLLTALNGS